MSDTEVFLDVQIIPAVFGEHEQWMMMAYTLKRRRCITFAVEEGDGVWIPGPVPAHLVECEDCRQELAASLSEEGFALTHTPEQITMIA